MKIVEHNDPIGIYPGYRKQKAPAQQKFIEGFFKPPSVLVASARSGLVLGLRSLGFSRQDEIWVPPYLSHCVLSALTSVMMPSLAASSRTKAVLVFHQFGFIGDVGQIAKVAKRNKWAVVHDCAHSFFSSYRGQPVMSLGDFAVTSFPKTFPSVLGGAVCSQNKKFITQLQGHINSSDAKVESTFAKKAFSVLKKAKSDNLQITTLEVESVYGFLPELKRFFQQGYEGIPGDAKSIETEKGHRRAILELVVSFGFLPRKILRTGTVPFAIPIPGHPKILHELSSILKKQMNLDAPVLHFDFAMNMQRPDYRPALILGCHKEWTEPLVKKACLLLKEKL